MNKQNTLRENRGSIFNETQREIPLDYCHRQTTETVGQEGLPKFSFVGFIFWVGICWLMYLGKGIAEKQGIFFC